MPGPELLTSGAEHAGPELLTSGAKNAWTRATDQQC
jgi:hypothetical protein